MALPERIAVVGIDSPERWGAKTATVASMAWAPGESRLVGAAVGVDGDNAGDLIVLHPDGRVVNVARYHNGLCCAARFDW